MAIKIKFDNVHQALLPTMILATRSGKKIAALNADNITLTDNLNEYAELSFNVYKNLDNEINPIWDDIKDFKLIWIREWDKWFEIYVDVDESDDTVKKVTAKSLGEAELSQIYVHDLDINSDTQMAQDDYKPIRLYDPANPKYSLLNLVIDFAPHYSIKHVDTSLINYERSFSFDKKSIYDCLNEIAEEIGCLFIYNSSTNSEGEIDRSISVYDLETLCYTCGYRGQYSNVCPQCGSTNLSHGYGEDTTVFISADNLANEISLKTDVNSVFNCFCIDTDDENLLNAIKDCNPNGTQYLWYVTDDVKSDMSDELVERLEEYDNDYLYYQNDHVITLNNSITDTYNRLIAKYNLYNNQLHSFDKKIKGYTLLMDNIYDCLDFENYLTSGMLPEYTNKNNNAAKQSTLINFHTMSPCPIKDFDFDDDEVDIDSIDSSILSLAQSLISPDYEVTIRYSTYNDAAALWTGMFTVTNKNDETDTANTPAINITISDDYSLYIKYKLMAVVHEGYSDFYDIHSVFDKSGNNFATALKNYNLDELNGFVNINQSCLDLLVQEGISDAETWDGEIPDMYKVYYLDYYNKKGMIEKEIALREDEIVVIKDMQTEAYKRRDEIQKMLDFQSFLGADLWKEFYAYRRENTYDNKNYSSSELSNAELIAKARELLELAKKDLHSSATLQHSISTKLRNLLVIKEFEPLLDYFAVGNWIRIFIDGKIYKLRLISYTIDYDDLDNIDVDFSDVMIVADGVTDVKSILDQAQSISSSYQSVERQAAKSSEKVKAIDLWFESGLNATLTKIINDADHQTMQLDEHGLLLREYDDFTDRYLDEQMKIINSTLAITDDNWRSTKTAIGKFFYTDPSNNKLTKAYGVNAETVVGKLLIGENLALYNSSGNLTFNQNGLSVTNGINTININPNSKSVFALLKGTSQVVGFNSSGDLDIVGNITTSGVRTDGKKNSSRLSSGALTVYIDNVATGRVDSGIFNNKSGIGLMAQKNGYLGLGYDFEGSPTISAYLDGTTGYWHTNTRVYFDTSYLIALTNGGIYCSNNFASEGKIMVGNVDYGTKLSVNGSAMVHSLRVGTTNPAYDTAISVDGSITCYPQTKRNCQVSIDSQEHSIRFLSNTNGNAGLYSDLWSTWLIRCSGSTGTIATDVSSDKRLKNIVGDTKDNDVKQLLENLHIVDFSYKKDNSNLIQQGVIAQELRDTLLSMGITRSNLISLSNQDTDIIDDLTADDSNGMYGVDYTKFIPYLIKGWQYLNDKCNMLENQNKNLLKVIENGGY